MKSPRVWPVFLGFVVAVLAMLVSATVTLILWFGPKLAQSPAASHGVTGLLLTTGPAEVALLLCALAFARPLSVERLRLGRSPVRPLTLAAITLGTISGGQTLESISTLLGFHDVGSLAELRRTLSQARGIPLLLSFLTIGVLGGCAEELFFRGFAQTRLVQRWGRSAGVSITSVLFGLMHMDAVHAVLACGIGLWLGYASERASSIRPAIFAHVTNNIAATALTAAGLDAPAGPLDVVVAAISAAVFALCAWQLVNDAPPRPTAAPQSAAG